VNHMISRTWRTRYASIVWIARAVTNSTFALDARKSLSEYSRTMWTQQQGLTQDTIRAITQTTDGYLWLGSSWRHR